MAKETQVVESVRSFRSLMQRARRAIRPKRLPVVIESSVRPSRRAFVTGLLFTATALAMSSSPVKALGYPNDICFAGQYGMVGDYLTPGAGSYGGGVNSAFTDNTPAWNAIMANAQHGDAIIIPRGYCGFKSKPNSPPDFVKVEGTGSFSGLVRCYAPSGTEDIFIEVAPNYSTFRSLVIVGGNGYAGGIGIGHMATGINNCAYGTILDNIVVSYFQTSGRFYGACKFNGVAGAEDYGARSIRVTNCLFKASNYGLLGISLNAITVDGLIVPEAITGIWLIGVNVPYNPMRLSRIDGILACSIKVQNSRNVFITGTNAGLTTVDADTVSCTIIVNSMSPHPPAGPLPGINNHISADGQHWHS